MIRCPIQGSYCDLSHTHETCLFHSTGASCIHRIKTLMREKEGYKGGGIRECMCFVCLLYLSL